MGRDIDNIVLYVSEMGKCFYLHVIRFCFCFFFGKEKQKQNEELKLTAR